MAPQTETNHWWYRHRGWMIPVGVIALFISMIASFVMFAFGLVKSSDAYKQAMVIVRQSPAINEALGQPIKVGLFVSGNISIQGPSGKAELAIPVYGSKGGATVFVEATKSAGLWTFQKLIVKIEQTGARIDLLNLESSDSRKPLNAYIDRLRTNGKLSIPFTASLSNQSKPAVSLARRQALPSTPAARQYSAG